MPFQVSPGVNVSEVDLTTVIPAVSTSVGAFAGDFNWGPAEVVTLVESQDTLASMFGKPDANTYESFFSAANFLDYTNALRVVRAAHTDMKNAASGNGAAYFLTLCKNDDHYESSEPTSFVVGKYPGEMGNGLQVEICDSEDAFGDWTSNTQFPGPPGTSTYANTKNSANDEMHVIVKDNSKGSFSGTASAVLERWTYVSKALDAKDDEGNESYYKNKINQGSAYIRFGAGLGDVNAHSASNTTTWGTAATDGKQYGISATKYANTLAGGQFTAGTDANIQTAYDLLKDTDQVDISLVIAGPHSPTVSQHILDNIADFRKDCVAFVSPEKDDVVGNSSDAARLTAVQNYKDVQLNRATSYGVMDSGWKYQYDKYSGKYRWIPLNADVAGLCAKTDGERDAWWSPAGHNRGHIKNVVKLAYNPIKAHRDDLYRNSINPVVTFPGEGTILFGDKTLQSRPSAFDRINVRRLFIVLEKAISTAAKFSLFEFNDDFTRSQFRNMVEPFLRTVQGRRGVTDFKVVCDETNNTGDVIDRNEFVGDIYIKPTRSINFIQLNFVAVSTGVDFTEIVGKF